MTQSGQDAYLFLVDDALALQRAGDHQRAVERLEEARAHLPGYAPLHLLLGMSLEKVGRLEEAATELRQALAIEPAYPEAEKALGVFLLEAERWEEAAQVLRSLTEKDPQAGLAGVFYYLLAMRNLGRPQEAREVVTAAWDKAGDCDSARDVGWAFRRFDWPAEAEAFLRHASARVKSSKLLADLAQAVDDQGRADEAAALLRRAVALDASDADAWNRLSEILVEAERLPEALEAAKRSVDLSGDNGHAWAQYAFVLMASGQLEQALEATRHAQRVSRRGEAEPNGLEMLLMLQEAMCLSLLGRAQDAIAVMEEDKRRFPTDQHVAGFLAELWLRKGDAGRALQVIHGALSEGVPADSSLLSPRFLALHRLGRTDDAGALVQGLFQQEKFDIIEDLAGKALREFEGSPGPESAALLDQLSDFGIDRPVYGRNMAFVMAGAGDIREALTQMGAVFAHAKTNKDQAPPLVGMAYLHLLQGELESAATVLHWSMPEQAQVASAHVALWRDGRVAPDAVKYPTRSTRLRDAIRANRVTLLMAQGKASQARALAQRMIRERPETPLGHSMLGWVLLDKGDAAGARRAWEKALEITKDHQDRQALSDWLTSLPPEP